MIKNEIDTLKNSYFEKRINVAENVKSLWNTFNNMGIAANSLPTPFKFFNVSEINKYFAEVSILHSPVTNDCLNNILSIPLNPDLPVFTFLTIDVTTISSALEKFKSSASRINGLTANSLKISFPVIINCLTDIFNKSLKEGYFLKDWKKTLIFPLSKKKNVQSLLDLRSIAHLCVDSKLLGRI